MWAVGVAWDGDGYVAAGAHADGRLRGPRRFPAHPTGVGELIAYIRESTTDDANPAQNPTAPPTTPAPADPASPPAGAVIVIDPSNGIVEGALHPTGLRVVRSRRTAGRGQDALRMAREFHTEGPAPDPTDADRAALDAAIAASGPAERRLGSAGRWLARGPAGHRRIALTFDDGPCPPYTDRVLDVLRDHGVVATFFCVGLHARSLPATVARIVAEGHTVANHTWSHPSLVGLTRDEVRHQLDATGRAIAEVTGERPALMRPPYGDRSPRTLEWIAAEGLTTVLWDTDTRDWSRPGTDAVADRALNGARDGSVVLMHDGGGDRTHTVEALPRIIGGLLSDGYRLVTVDRMSGPGTDEEDRASRP